MTDKTNKTGSGDTPAGEGNKPPAAENSKPPAADAQPKPSIGRVVIYHEGGNRKPGGYSARISHVHQDGSVNLAVDNDRSFPLLAGANPERVPMLEPGQTPAEILADGPINGWHWPLRV